MVSSLDVARNKPPLQKIARALSPAPMCVCLFFSYIAFIASFRVSSFASIHTASVGGTYGESRNANTVANMASCSMDVFPAAPIGQPNKYCE